jgi:hypothetical protein
MTTGSMTSYKAMKIHRDVRVSCNADLSVSFCFYSLQFARKKSFIRSDYSHSQWLSGECQIEREPLL